jgi:hypothetical protein
MIQSPARWERHIAVEGWSVTAVCYREGDLYVCEATDLDSHLVSAVARTRDDAEHGALEILKDRFRSRSGPTN